METFSISYCGSSSCLAETRSAAPWATREDRKPYFQEKGMFEAANVDSRLHLSVFQSGQTRGTQCDDQDSFSVAPAVRSGNAVSILDPKPVSSAASPFLASWSVAERSKGREEEVPTFPTWRSATSNKSEISAELVGRAVWDEFDKHTNEMIVTRRGRRVFPTLKFILRHLVPSKLYHVVVDLVPADALRYRFTSGKWLPCGQGQDPYPNQHYLHPDSPNTGRFWSGQTISFNRMKISSEDNLRSSNILVSSMQKYQPRLLIYSSNPNHPEAVFAFTETQFIAVTAYQNTQITDLKIKYNPFAKGFLKDGRRKR